MAGADPPFTTWGVNFEKIVDGQPMQAMTVWAGRPPYGAVILARRLWIGIQAEARVMQRFGHLNDTAEVLIVERVLGVTGALVEAGGLRRRIHHRLAAADRAGERFGFSQHGPAVTVALAVGIDPDQTQGRRTTVQVVDPDGADRAVAAPQQHGVMPGGQIIAVGPVFVLQFHPAADRVEGFPLRLGRRAGQPVGGAVGSVVGPVIMHRPPACTILTARQVG